MYLFLLQFIPHTHINPLFFIFYYYYFCQLDKTSGQFYLHCYKKKIVQMNTLICDIDLNSDAVSKEKEV